MTRLDAVSSFLKQGTSEMSQKQSTNTTSHNLLLIISLPSARLSWHHCILARTEHAQRLLSLCKQMSIANTAVSSVLEHLSGLDNAAATLVLKLAYILPPPSSKSLTPNGFVVRTAASPVLEHVCCRSEAAAMFMNKVSASCQAPLASLSCMLQAQQLHQCWINFLAAAMLQQHS